MQFHIENMTCQHCVRAVTRAIQSTFPSAEVEIDLAKKSAEIRTDASEEAIRQLLAEAGYPVGPAEPSGQSRSACCQGSPGNRLRTAALALFAGVLASATVPSAQAAGALSDIWWAPEQPGWALTIEHRTDHSQGIATERGYALLNAFDAEGKPRWFSVVLASAGIRANGLPAFEGEVYETNREANPEPIDAAANSTPVGYMQIEPVTANRLILAYEIEGASTSTTIERYTALPESLDGHYSTTTNAQITTGGQTPQTTVTFGRVLITSTGDQVILQEITDQRVCAQNGSMIQTGKLLRVSGNYHCNDGEQGTFALTELSATPHGFTGRLQRTTGNRSTTGKLAWARIGG